MAKVPNIHTIQFYQQCYPNCTWVPVQYKCHHDNTGSITSGYNNDFSELLSDLGITTPGGVYTQNNAAGVFFVGELQGDKIDAMQFKFNGKQLLSNGQENNDYNRTAVFDGFQLPPTENFFIFTGYKVTPIA